MSTPRISAVADFIQKINRDKHWSHYYEYRFDTFIEGNWPYIGNNSFLAQPESLASAGFYYAPQEGHLDNVKCAYCDKELDDWYYHDDPFVVHYEHSKTCIWARTHCRQRYCEKKGEQFYPWPNKTREDKEILLDYINDKESRLATFGSHWPHYNKKNWKVTPQTLSSAGFYYIPDKKGDDAVKCGSCNCTLDFWEPEDNPSLEHLTRQASCLFFQKDLIQEEIGLLPKTPAKKRSSEQIHDDILHSNKRSNNRKSNHFELMNNINQAIPTPIGNKQGKEMDGTLHTPVIKLILNEQSPPKKHSHKSSEKHINGNTNILSSGGNRTHTSLNSRNSPKNKNHLQSKSKSDETEFETIHQSNTKSRRISTTSSREKNSSFKRSPTNYNYESTNGYFFDDRIENSPSYSNTEQYLSDDMETHSAITFSEFEDSIIETPMTKQRFRNSVGNVAGQAAKVRKDMGDI
ncbi:hypothetical protein BB558_001943 [Smittium angustum]|uniref:Inhibitor of apoptosis repeat-containing protein n=1 Tax=Smittium angustum TaxID=133377 RepID=A0A2U1J9Z6_SMIAN|nr:hypothetical protein BB558_001943 [Smittium angustum]